MLDISLDNNLFITDKTDAAVQELDLLFNTENTELIGYTDYGTNWWQYLWQLTPSVSDMRNYIANKIANTYFASQFHPVIDVEFAQGTHQSIYYVKITLKNDNDEEVTVQQYTLK